MKVLRVRLKNIYQHRDIDVEITGSRIALVGPNGGGKSNFLNAIGEVVHGEFHQNKDRIVTWGQDTGSSFVDIELQNKRRLEISREFPSGSASLSIFSPGLPVENIKGAAKVNERILKELEVDKGVLQNIVFVGQKEIDDVLFSKAGEKDRLAQKFFGLQSANAFEKLLTKEISSLSSDSFASSLPAMIESRAASAAEIARLEAEILAYESPDVLLEKSRELDQQIKSASEINLKIQAYRALIESRLALEARYNKDVVEYSELHTSHSKVDIESAKQSLEFDRKIEQAILEHRKLVDRKSSLLSSIERLGNRPDSEEEIKKSLSLIESMRSEVEALASQVAPKQRALSEIGTRSQCPTCGQPIDISGRSAIEAELLVIEPQLANKRSELTSLVSITNQRQAALNQWENESLNLNRALGDLQKSIAAAEVVASSGGVGFVGNSAYWAGAISAYDQNLNSLVFQHKNLTKTKSEIDQIDARLPLYSEVLDNGKIRDQISISDLQAHSNKIRSSQLEVNSLVSNIANSKRGLALIDDQIVKARSALAMNSANDEIRSVLSLVRAAFHPDGAPKILVSRSTKKLESRINHYLSAMQAKFRVSAKDGLSFNCHFSNGVSLDTELSVGQKVALSWSFRLAACETFSSSVGLMTMDEPTAALDVQTSGAFLDVVESMKDLSEKHGMQFFIATHSEGLARACDQVIKVDAKSED